MKINTEIKPIFLLGAGRSGTKFLRDILGASSDISVIPYDISYVWRYENDDCPHDELTPDMLNDKIKTFIKKTLPKLAVDSTSKQATFFIEKSVPNTLRPAFIQAIYPDAKFIHLTRDGRSVTESALRLWKQPPKRSYLLQKLKYFPVENYTYALRYAKEMIKNAFSSDIQHIWGPRYEGISEDVKNLPIEVVCARQWKKCIKISLAQLREFDQENIINIRYEDLMLNSKALESICDFIGIEDKDIIIENYDRKVIRTNMKKWEGNLSPEQLELINDEIGTLNAKLGYT